MKRYNKVSIFLFLLVILSRISFGYDITRFLYLDLKGEFDSPLILKDAEKICFTDGWRNLNAIPTAVKKTVMVNFFLSKRKNINLNLTIEKNHKLPRDIDINIIVNDKFLKKITIKLIRDLHLFIPLYFLHKGDNLITFDVNDNYKNDKFFQTCTDVAFFTVKKFEFKNFLSSSKSYKSIFAKNRFTQPVNTEFSVFITPETEKNIYLEFYKLRKKGRGDLLEISYNKRGGSANIFKIIEIKSRVEKVNLNLKSLKKDSNYMFYFKYSSPDSGNYIVWKKFEIIESNKIKNNMSFSPEKNHFKTNIFLVVLDAFRKDLINKKIYGREVTPNLNRFSLTSTVYNRCYSTAPYTGASVTSMMTGLLPETHTVRSSDNILPEKIRTLPFFLKSEGYKSYAFIGNPIITNSKITKDFDKVVSIFTGGSNLLKKIPDSENDIKKILKSIKKLKRGKPAFVYIHFLPPHPPFNPPEKKYKIFSTLHKEKIKHRLSNKSKDIEMLFAEYLDNAYYADKLVGSVIKELKNEKIFDNSLIIFTADHGEEFCDHGNIGHGNTNYNELIHIPFVVKFPFQKKKINNTKLISLLGLTPSIVHMVKAKEYAFFQGSCNLFSKSLISDYDDNFVYSRAVGKKINSSIISNNGKFILNSGSEKYFDLSKDRYEKNNLIKNKRWESAFFKHAIYKIIIKNLLLKKKLKIKVRKGKFPKNKIKELKTLGYLL